VGNKCLADVLLDALLIIMPCKGGDDNKGNVCDCNGECSTIDIIIEKQFHRLIVINIIVFTSTRSKYTDSSWCELKAPLFGDGFLVFFDFKMVSCFAKISGRNSWIFVSIGLHQSRDLRCNNM
jgi:hypothetical protein